LDASLLEFPLVVRHWQPGDWFCPLGMGGKRQKLQDFFSNNKLTRFEKEKTWLLECGGNIVWVVGWRLDERFKVTSATKSVIQAVFL
jgi:tRNA(Ile)-lysidine synthase